MSVFSFAMFSFKPLYGYRVEHGGNKFQIPYFRMIFILMIIIQNLSLYPEERKDTYACTIGLTIVRWMFCMDSIICIGIPFIMLLNLGNSLHHVPVFGRPGVLLVAVLLVILTDWFVFDFYVVVSTPNPASPFLSYRWSDHIPTCVYSSL